MFSNTEAIAMGNDYCDKERKMINETVLRQLYAEGNEQGIHDDIYM